MSLNLVGRHYRTHEGVLSFIQFLTFRIYPHDIFKFEKIEKSYIEGKIIQMMFLMNA